MKIHGYSVLLLSVLSFLLLHDCLINTCPVAYIQHTLFMHLIERYTELQYEQDMMLNRKKEVFKMTMQVSLRVCMYIQSITLFRCTGDSCSRWCARTHTHSTMVATIDSLCLQTITLSIIIIVMFIFLPGTTQLGLTLSGHITSIFQHT